MNIVTSKKQEKTDSIFDEPIARERLLAALETLAPLTKEEAEMINKAVMQAQARNAAETNITGRRERVMALRAKLKPISQEDADRINEAIMEAREASIVRDLSA